MARCAHVVCVSEFTRRTLLDIAACSEDRTSVIPQAVEAHFQPLDPGDDALGAFRRRHGLEGKRVVLHVGTCLPYKNIGGLLEIFRSLPEDVVLLKVGGTFAPEEQQLIARHGLEPRLAHRTQLSEPDLVLAYNAADLLLWPSRFEGFGLPVLEAMACGTPVVCSDGGALPEVAGEAARVHPVDDLAGMAASCVAILANPEEAAALRAAGLARAKAYTWEAAARAYCNVYHAVAAGRAP
ncbi:MAG: glycosyltransferase family 4 protein [Candidatus Hydrogenedentes bacterium]|nr:glycosyltransferase family 4 protein [Candidatus Hydrogenedentota bacterium]